MKPKIVMIITGIIILNYIIYASELFNPKYLLLINLSALIILLYRMLTSQTYQALIDATELHKNRASWHEDNVKILRKHRLDELISTRQLVKEELENESQELNKLKYNNSILQRELESLNDQLFKKSKEIEDLTKRIRGCALALKKERKKDKSS